MTTVMMMDDPPDDAVLVLPSCWGCSLLLTHGNQRLRARDLLLSDHGRGGWWFPTKVPCLEAGETACPQVVVGDPGSLGAQGWHFHVMLCSEAVLLTAQFTLSF